MREYNVSQLQPEEKAALILTEAYRELLDYIKCEHVLFRVDLAFKVDKAAYIYSIDDMKIKSKSDILLNSDDFNNGMITSDAMNEDIKMLFRKHLHYENNSNYYMLVSEGRFVGFFDANTKVYAALISYREEVSPIELFDSLFAGLLNDILNPPAMLGRTE